MNLNERYVKAVGRRLPKRKRDDIEAELRSNLADALDGRGADESSDEDVIAVLKEFGPPEEVAASFSGDQYLIGPGLYPQFVTTLKIGVTVICGLIVLGAAVSVLASESLFQTLTARMAGVVTSLVDSAITMLGIVVVVFAVLERLDVRIDSSERLREWDPRELPVVHDADLVPRFDSIAGIVFPAIVVALLNRFKDHIGLAVQEEGKRFQLGAVSDPGDGLLLNQVLLDNLPWINASLLLPMALSVWLFWAGRWHLVSRVLKIGCDVFGLYVFLRVCQGVIAARADLLGAGLPERVVDVFLRGAELAPILVAIGVVVGGSKHLYRAWQSVT